MTSHSSSVVLGEPIQLRRMGRDDLEAVMSIERACFPNAWRRRDFLAWLADSHTQAWIAERHGQVVGFIVYQRQGDVVHLCNLAVDPHYRRHQIGTELVSHAIREAAADGAAVRLEVRESNLDAQLFYRHLGFKAIGIRHGHYADSGEDAYVMQHLPDRGGAPPVQR